MGMWEWMALMVLGAAVILQGITSAAMWGKVSTLESVEDNRRRAEARKLQEEWDRKTKAVYDLHLAAEKYLLLVDVQTLEGRAACDARSELLNALSEAAFLRNPANTPEVILRGDCSYLLRGTLKPAT